MVRLNLSGLDWLVVGGFALAVLALGLSARLRRASSLEFLAAGRQITLPFFVASLVSTWYGGILGIGESVTYYGVGTWLLMGVPYYLFGTIYAVVYAHRVRQEDQISIPERLAAKLGKGPALLGAGLMFLLAVPSAHALMLGVLVQTLTGWPLWISVVVSATVGLAFLSKGGLVSDVRVSSLSFLAMYVGFGVMLVWCLQQRSFGDAVQALPDPNLRTLHGGAGPVAIVSFLLLGLWTLVDPGFHQRSASVASPDLARKGVLICVGFWMLFDLLSIGVGIYAIGMLKAMPENPLHIFPALAEQVLPSGLKGLFLIGILGTVLTAFAGYTLVAGGSFGRDLIARARGISDEAAVKWTRGGIFVSSAVAIVIGLSLDSVVAIWYAWAGLIVGAMLLPFAASYGAERLQRISSPAWTASIAVGFVGSLAWLIWGYTHGNPYLNVTWFGAEFSLGTLVPALALSAGTLLAWQAFAIIRGSKGGSREPTPGD